MTGFKFHLNDSSGNPIASYEDLEYTFVKKDMWSDAGLYTVGDNQYGQLGHGDIVSRSVPTRVGALTTWKTASIDSHLLAIKNDGTLWSCGWNSDGQLGSGTITNRSSPVQVGALTDWKYISAGASHSLAIKKDNSLWSWGYNGEGQLGSGTITHRSSPVQVGTNKQWKYIAAGGSSLAIKYDGTLWAWGLGVSTPTQIGTDTDWKYIKSVSFDNYAIKTDNSLHYVDIGFSYTYLVEEGYDWVLYDVGDCEFKITTAGKLFARGTNDYGQTGLDTIDTYINTFTQVGSLNNWSRVKSLNGSSFGIRTDGSLWYWGNPAYGDLQTSTPVQVGSLNTWALLSDSGTASLALIANEQL